MNLRLKAVAFGEALTDDFLREYAVRVKLTLRAMACGTDVAISGGLDSHLMLIDLRSKELTGKLPRTRS
jgi:glycine hydroxymethyltransferase